MTDLYQVLSKLRLTQYFDKFSEEGFESWETVLDITESDLDALGVKLGHRRILQREIALTRGVPVEQQILSSKSASLDRGASVEETQVDVKGGIGTGVKRKYRRHPKIDENAPERPPSAYVIFSNRIREELKPQNWSFTAIAKKVGERWQELPAEEKERYESEASASKEKYHMEMAEYKTTKAYREYQQYLADFKAKNSSTSDDKRLKLAQEEGRASSANTEDHPIDTGDFLSAHTDRKFDVTSSGGHFSTESGCSSPTSSISRPSVMRSGYTYMTPFGNTSPTISYQSTPSAHSSSLSGRQLQAMTHDHQTADLQVPRISSNPGRYPVRFDEKEIQPLVTTGAPLNPLDPRLFQVPTNPLDNPRRRVPSLLQQSTSGSSKSSVASTWSGSSTASSSINPPTALDEPKKTGLSLPPLVAVTGSSSGGTLASAEPIAARPKITSLAGRTATSKTAQQISQSPSASSSTGMKFESLQLPLPYNISFGQRPLPRPEHEKLANIFDLQDIPGGRKSFRNLTLGKEHTGSLPPSVSQSLPEPKHPPHIPKLPNLSTQPLDDDQDSDLHPNADPLSVLAYAGRLVGRDNRRP